MLVEGGINMSNKTLSKYLEDNIKNNVIDHAIRAHKDDYGNIVFYIHPANVSGDTLDFLVDENVLYQMNYED